MTQLITLEDALLAGGEEVPAKAACPACNRDVPPFTIVSVDGEFICSTCLETRRREEAAAAEALAREANRDTWSGADGDAVRAQRDALLNRYSWTLQRGSPLTEACQMAFENAFQQLHRLTIDYPRPSEVVWPTIPPLEYPEGE